jgi:hypothetical protein
MRFKRQEANVQEGKSGSSNKQQKATKRQAEEDLKEERGEEEYEYDIGRRSPTPEAFYLESPVTNPSSKNRHGSIDGAVLSQAKERHRWDLRKMLTRSHLRSLREQAY